MISSSVTTIADNAFQKSGIKEIVIPASVKTIGEAAFGSSLIETVTFKGDIAIQRLCGMICSVFKHSPVFRIGGDEFLVVLQNSDLANREILFEQFDRNCAQSLVNETARISVRIALGFARFEAGKDQCFADVFKRADEAMYRNKRTSKMGRD